MQYEVELPNDTQNTKKEKKIPTEGKRELIKDRRGASCKHYTYSGISIEPESSNMLPNPFMQHGRYTFKKRFVEETEKKTWK